MSFIEGNRKHRQGASATYHPMVDELYLPGQHHIALLYPRCTPPSSPFQLIVHRLTVSCSFFHPSLLPRRFCSNSSLTSRGPQNGSQAVQPLGRSASSLVSKRNSHTQRGRTLLVRAADNDGSSEADARRLEELEARLGVNRKSRREGGGAQSPPPAPKPAAPAKAWDDMSLAEKAWQLYIGEEGALFWLNKAAYASIFIIIGGWIVFRFIGPALGWYELSSPLLPPEQVIAGTAGR